MKKTLPKEFSVKKDEHGDVSIQQLNRNDHIVCHIRVQPKIQIAVEIGAMRKLQVHEYFSPGIGGEEGQGGVIVESYSGKLLMKSGDVMKKRGDGSPLQLEKKREPFGSVVSRSVELFLLGNVRRGRDP